jgi:menaquinone-9 beta-reductase
MEEKHYDVVIVGAGPAGSSAAISLASTNLKIALLDKSTFPRDKTCGDALSIDVENQLGMMSPELLKSYKALTQKQASYGVKIVATDDNFIDLPLFYKGEKRCGYVSPRIDFDNLLFQHAKQYPNVDTYDGSGVEKIEEGDEHIKVYTRDHCFTAQIIIGADGAHSIVNKHFGNIAVEKKHYSAGLRIYYEGITGFHEDNLIELHFFKDMLPGYLWIFPLHDNKANVGIGMSSEAIANQKVKLKESLQQLIASNPRLKDRFKDAKPLESIKGYGLPLGSKKRNISGNRYLLTGDAASLIDPFSGEGIANAIRSGRVAAAHIKNCFEANDFSAKFNKAYDQEIYKKMWKEFKISYFLQKMTRYPWLCNLIVRKANTSKTVRRLLYEALGSIEKRKKLISKPSFYFRLLGIGK